MRTKATTPRTLLAAATLALSASGHAAVIAPNSGNGELVLVIRDIFFLEFGYNLDLGVRMDNFDWNTSQSWSLNLPSSAMPTYTPFPGAPGNPYNVATDYGPTLTTSDLADIQTDIETINGAQFGLDLTGLMPLKRSELRFTIGAFDSTLDGSGGFSGTRALISDRQGSAAPAAVNNDLSSVSTLNNYINANSADGNGNTVNERGTHATSAHGSDFVLNDGDPNGTQFANTPAGFNNNFANLGWVAEMAGVDENVVMYLMSATNGAVNAPVVVVQQSGYFRLDLDNGTLNYITAVPVPAALWLFGTALVGLGSIARRNRAS